MLNKPDLMSTKVITIKKRADFLRVKSKGTTYKSNSLIIQKLFDKKLNNSIRVGYTATKKLGTAVKRNRAKRLMRELVKKEIINYGRINFFYVVIAKREIFDTPNIKLREEFRNLLLKNEKNI